MWRPFTLLSDDQLAETEQPVLAEILAELFIQVGKFVLPQPISCAAVGQFVLV